MRHPIAYGIDLAGDTIVVARHIGRGALEVSRHPADRAAEGLAPIQAMGLAGQARVAVALPATLGFARWLQTPFSSRAKAARVLPSVLDIQLPFPVESCACAFPAYREPADEGTAGLAVAAQRDELRSLIDAWKARGVDPDLVLHEALALWRLADDDPAPRDAVIYLGDDHTTLVLGDDEGFRSAHGIPAGSQADEGAAARLAKRIDHVLRSRIDAPRAAIRWTGPGAADNERVQWLEEQLEAADPARSAVDKDPASGLARALALAAAQPDAPAENLRHGDLAHAGSRSRRARRDRVRWGAAAAAAVLLIALNLGWRHLLDARNDRLQEAVTLRATELSGLPAVPRGEEVFAVQQALAGGSAIHPFRRAFLPGAAQLAAQVTEAAYEAGLWPSDLHVHPGGYRLRATALSPAAGDKLKTRLEARGLTAILTSEPLGSTDQTLLIVTGGAAVAP